MGSGALKRLAGAIAVVIAIVVGPAIGVGPAKAGPYRALAVLAQQDDPGAPRSRAPLTLLQINDVYSTVPIDGMGGLARVATIKQNLIAQGRAPLLVLAGDFLSPSVASSVFKGEQMIAALNAAGLDLATLGNHEFDFGDELLLQRMKEAKWQWIVANVIDRTSGKPIGGAEPFVIRTFGTLKVGFIGLCLNTTEISPSKLTHTRLLDPLATAARYVPIMKRGGAQVIVAVTHLAFDDDRELVERLGIDLVIGGHEHYPITGAEGRAFISKAGSDAKWVARIDINRRSTGTVERFYELIPVTSAIADEPRTAEVVAAYESKLGTELDVTIGETTVPLDAESGRLRALEAPIGNLFADAIREDTGADVALMNSGSIRGDRIYPAGPLTRRLLLTMHPFGNVICTIDVSGSVLLQALENGVSKLPASAGQFPQVSGMTLRVDADAAAGRRVRDVIINGRPLDLTRNYTLSLPDYLLKGGDSYSMFANQRVIVGPETGNLLVSALEKYVVAHRPIAPAAEGRVTILR